MTKDSMTPHAYIDPQWDSEAVTLAAKAIRTVTSKVYSWDYGLGERQMDGKYARDWHVDLQRQFKLHPVVLAMLKYRPDNYHTLVLEWPHVSEKEPSKLSYTRDEFKGKANVQTVTTISKYLSKHWARVPDHIRRDACSLYTPDTLKMLAADVRQTIWACEVGPRSCMQSTSSYAGFPWSKRGQRQKMLAWDEDSTLREPEWNTHPYAVYTPELGWGMAVRMVGDRVMGRALTYESKSHKGFVRSYARGVTDENMSETDTALSAWLEAKGFSKEGSWPEGAEIAYIENVHECDTPLLPYMDGDRENVTESGSGKTLVITSDQGGNWKCENQDGTGERNDSEEDEENERLAFCEDCDDSIYEGDDYIIAGRYEDRFVCCHCSRDYTQVTAPGRWTGTATYHLPDDETVRVNRQDYDPANLPDCIIMLEDGDHAHEDDAIRIDDECYLHSDYRVVELHEENPDTGDTYGLIEDCWEDERTGYMWPNCVECVERGSYKYHQDTIDEMDEEAEEDEEAQAAPAIPETI